MLEIKNANKYFNKGKKNQIHAIDNTTLTLENNGLVALLGPSGCGKTTLLNTIGGLDNLKSGSIKIDSQKISSKLSSKADKIRSLSIGYIFQDYKLIDNMTVYDNVALVLKMIGIKDKKEIKNRVEYVLDKVGMLRYKKRPCSMLSGGERQRVGIARAIVKDPSIILADEPTGNLDSKNSLEIMKIIKSISKDRLVILVTHEANLAKFYASRIIEIKDGKVIKDYENIHNDELDYQLDNTFYLKDFNNNYKLNDDKYNINIYTNDNDKIKLDIVIKEKNIYIRSNTNDKIEVIDENSGIDLINDHYKKIDKKDIDKYQFNFQKIINKNIIPKYSSIFNPLTLIINGFKKVFDYSTLKKILLIGFFLSGMFLIYAISSVAATIFIDDDEFIKINKNYLSVIQKNIKVEDFLSYETDENINYILPGDSIVKFNVAFKDYYQTSNLEGILSGSLSRIDMITENDLIYGRMPENDYEIVVDKLSIDNMYSEGVAKMAGLSKIEDMLNRNININNMNPFTIVGIVEKSSPSIYMSQNLFTNIISNNDSNNNSIYHVSDSKINDTLFIDYELYKDKIQLKKGTYPANDYEVIVNINNQIDMPLNKETNIKINNKKLKVVGYYDSLDNYNYYFVNNTMIKYNNIINKNNMTIYSKDKNNTLTKFRDKKLNILYSYEKDKQDYLDDRKEFRNSTLLASFVIIAISLLEVFLMIRSSFLSRIKEIGIYRAIGIKKIDIYKMFFGEILAITTIASIPGILLMSYFLSLLSKAESFKFISSIYYISPEIVILTIIFVYLFNLLIGLLPVFNTIRQKPAKILSRYDLD